MRTSTKVYIVLFLVTMVGGAVTSSQLLGAIKVGENGVYFAMTTLAWVSVGFNIINMIFGNILYFRFLKTRKYSSMLFFATAPLVIVFGGIVFMLSSLNNFSGKVVRIVKTALNVKTTNYNNYIFIGIVAIVVLVIMFITFLLLTRPVKKVEKATRMLSVGDVKDNFNIGGNKQFLAIESSLNKICDNFKKKDEMIKMTKSEYQKIVPKEMLKFLGKKNLVELEIGSQVKKAATMMICSIKSNKIFSNSVSLEENFNYVSSYHNLVSPIIRKFGGFVDKVINDDVLAVFVNSENAIICAKEIAKEINLKSFENKSTFVTGISIALHTSEVVFGVVGDDNQKSPTIISSSIDLLGKIDEFNNTFGSSIVFTKDFLDTLPSKSYLSRFVGELSLDNQSYALFECLDCYDRQNREKLVKFCGEFETGVRNFVAKNYEVAKDVFEKVHRKEKKDKVCYIYYNKCCENIDGGCVNFHE